MNHEDRQRNLQAQERVIFAADRVVALWDAYWQKADVNQDIGPAPSRAEVKAAETELKESIYALRDAQRRAR